MQSSGCSAAWVDECSTTWTGGGDDETLEMSVGYTGNNDPVYGVVLEGTGGSFPNAVSYNLPVSSISDGVLGVTVKTWSLSSAMDAKLRVQVLNSSNTVLSSQSWDVNADADDDSFDKYFVPVTSSAAATIRVTVGVFGLGDLLFLDGVDMEYDSESEWVDVTNGPECQAYICSCPAGTTKTACDFFWNDPWCTGNVTCVPNGTGDALDTSTVTGR